MLQWQLQQSQEHDTHALRENLQSASFTNPTNRCCATLNHLTVLVVRSQNVYNPLHAIVASSFAAFIDIPWICIDGAELVLKLMTPAGMITARCTKLVHGGVKPNN